MVIDGHEHCRENARLPATMCEFADQVLVSGGGSSLSPGCGFDSGRGHHTLGRRGVRSGTARGPVRQLCDGEPESRADWGANGLHSGRPVAGAIADGG